MVRLIRRKQNISILRTYGKSQSPLIFNLARNINLAGERTTSRGPKAESCPFIASCSREVEAVCVSHTDSGEGMLSLGRKAYLSYGEMSRSDREGIINCCSLALWERVGVRVLPVGKKGGVYVKH